MSTAPGGPRGPPPTSPTGARLLAAPPSDPGKGEVGPDGGIYFLIGYSTFTYDLKADVITSFEGRGQATDACQILSA